MNPTLPFFSIYIGNDVSQLVQIQLNSLPVDLTSASEISCMIANNAAQTLPFQTFTKTGNGIVLSNAIQGTFNLIITAAQSALLLEQSQVDIDFTVTISGKVQTYRIPNGLSVLTINS